MTLAVVHRVGDLRSCAAKSVESGNLTVFAGGRLVAVEGDPDSHGAGEIKPPAARTVFIGGLRIAAVGDPANPDNLCGQGGAEHCLPRPDDGIETVLVGTPAD